jgi:hypothetical protein
MQLIIKAYGGILCFIHLLNLKYMYTLVVQRFSKDMCLQNMEFVGTGSAESITGAINHLDFDGYDGINSTEDLLDYIKGLQTRTTLTGYNIHRPDSQYLCILVKS